LAESTSIGARLSVSVRALAGAGDDDGLTRFRRGGTFGGGRGGRMAGRRKQRAAAQDKDSTKRCADGFAWNSPVAIASRSPTPQGDPAKLACEIPVKLCFERPKRVFMVLVWVLIIDRRERQRAAMQ
jgi:hypothetical protein